MLVKKIIVSYGRTIPTKPYGGDRVDVTVEADIIPSDNEIEVGLGLLDRARALVNQAEAEVRALLDDPTTRRS